jgi:gp16 family phage-associated protein
METQEIKAILAENGLSVREFARAHGFSEGLVYSVLAKKIKGTRGESHKIAVALGLKTAPSADQQPDFVKKALLQAAIKEKANA